MYHETPTARLPRLNPIGCYQLLALSMKYTNRRFQVPFSPRWLVHHDRETEARKVLANLRGLSIDHELVELEFLEIKAQSQFEKRTGKYNLDHPAVLCRNESSAQVSAARDTIAFRVLRRRNMSTPMLPL